MATHLFGHTKFFRLLDDDDTEGRTFVFQYYTMSRKAIIKYIEDYASNLQEKSFQKMGMDLLHAEALQSVQ
jgi:hypothetical protein